MSVQLLLGDCLNLLPSLAESSIDTIIADPPAGIQFMGKEWDADRGGRVQWIAWLTERMKEGFRVLKPGGMALIWAIPRTSHWTATALEDAGFEIRDKIYHLFGQGFPKSHDISKAIDKMAGVEREVLRERMYQLRNNGGYSGGLNTTKPRSESCEITVPATPAAQEWDGYGTALKPACEEWILAMKPLDGTFAHNALEWGVAGINIDGGRIPTYGETISAGTANSIRNGTFDEHEGYKRPWKERDPELYASRLDAAIDRANAKGRWPSHVILDEEAGAMLDEMSGERPVSGCAKNGKPAMGEYIGGYDGFAGRHQGRLHNDSGGASRFFYCAKASRRERNAGLDGMEARRLPCKQGNLDGSLNKRTNGQPTYHQNHHPTVKPLSLMRYLCRLTKPPSGGVVLDMFMGSGTTGCAAVLEGRSFIGMEISDEYFAIAEKRIAHAQEKAALPLFDGEIDL